MWFDKRLDAVCVQPLFFVVDISNQDRKTEPIQNPLAELRLRFFMFTTFCASVDFERV
jgi:hypothetical protein